MLVAHTLTTNEHARVLASSRVHLFAMKPSANWHVRSLVHNVNTRVTQTTQKLTLHVISMTSLQFASVSVTRLGIDQ